MSDQTPKAPASTQVAAPRRRPYARPRVESRPLFERMALDCVFDADLGAKLGDS